MTPYRRELPLQSEERRQCIMHLIFVQLSPLPMEVLHLLMAGDTRWDAPIAHPSNPCGYTKVAVWTNKIDFF